MKEISKYMSKNSEDSIQDRIIITNPEKLYSPHDADGNPIDFEKVTGEQLLKHVCHNMTNHDEVLSQNRDENGEISDFVKKEATLGVSQKILDLYTREHVKVVQDSQVKGEFLKKLMIKAGVGTFSKLSEVLDSISEKLKQIAHLQNSQQSLQAWNDTYRVQRELVKKILITNNVDSATIEQVKLVYGTKSTNKAIDLGCKLLQLEESSILKLVQSSIRYGKSKVENRS